MQRSQRKLSTKRSTSRTQAREVAKSHTSSSLSNISHNSRVSSRAHSPSSSSFSRNISSTSFRQTSVNSMAQTRSFCSNTPSHPSLPVFHNTPTHTAITMPSRSFSSRRVDIVLTKDVEKLGKAGEIHRVKPGRARNHLVPQKMALLKSPDNLDRVRKMGLTVIERAADEEITVKAKTYLELQGDMIRNMNWVYHRSPVNSTDNHVSRPVTKHDVLTKLRNGKFYFVEQSEILFPEGYETLNHLGAWPVAVGLHGPDQSDWIQFEISLERSETNSKFASDDVDDEAPTPDNV